MKVAITLFVESQDEAKETLAALNTLNLLPWRQSVFGIGPRVPTATAKIYSVEHGEQDDAEPVVDDKVEPSSKVNVEPPGKATASVKRVTEQKLRALLVRPHSIEQIKPVMKAPKEHCENILRLLWDRGIITFDGKNYQNSESE